MDCHNAITLGGDDMRHPSAKELCAQDVRLPPLDKLTLCSWPKREKSLVVNGVPVVYFGRTATNAPMYWSSTAEIEAGSIAGIHYDRHYDWISMGETSTLLPDGHWEDCLFYTILVPNEIVPGAIIDSYVIRADYYSGPMKYVSDVIHGEVFVPDEKKSSSYGGFTRTDIFTSGDGLSFFSVWRDMVGDPLSFPKQPRVRPPEHRSGFRLLRESKFPPEDRLIFNMTAKDGVLMDSVWASFSGEGVMTRVNGTSLKYYNATCKIVDFVVYTNDSGLVVDAFVHGGSNRRSVFDYLDVLEQVSISGINLKIEDC